MSRFSVAEVGPEGLYVVERQCLGDARGFLSRLFCADELVAAGWTKPIAQINQSVTARRGTVRGMHFQWPPHAETKLVSCLRGAVWDVAVDLRLGSPTFLHWHAEKLTPSNRRALLIPEGFAHGFQTLEDDSELLYLHSAAYDPGAEGAVHFRDPRLGIAWPLPITEVSARDAVHPFVADDFRGMSL